MSINSIASSPVTTNSARSTPTLSIDIYRFCQTLSDTPFFRQDYTENIEKFNTLFSTSHEFIPLAGYLEIFEAFASFPFAGGYQCLLTVIRKFQEKFPEEWEAFSKTFLLPGSLTPNFFGMRKLIERKEERGVLPISLGSIKKTGELMREFLLSNESKRALILLSDKGRIYHYTPLLLEKINERLYLQLTDSVTTENRLNYLIEQIEEISHIIPCSFYYYNYSRQTDWHTCPYFSLNDAIKFIRTPYFFSTDESSQRFSITPVDHLPNDMMKYTQFFHSKKPLHRPRSLTQFNPDHRILRYINNGENLHAESKETKYLSCLLLFHYID